VSPFSCAPGAEVGENLLDEGSQGDFLDVHPDAAGLEFGDGEEIFDEELEAFGVSLDGLQEFGFDFGIVLGAVQQGST